MRRIHVCLGDGGDGGWMCNAFTHWTCKRSRSRRSCDKSHYSQQRRNASAFFRAAPRPLAAAAQVTGDLEYTDTRGEPQVFALPS